MLAGGAGTAVTWVYFVFTLLWYLTIVNSFNFSDNMNGLMSGLAVIALSAAVVYLGSQVSLRTMTIAALLEKAASLAERRASSSAWDGASASARLCLTTALSAS